MGKTSSSVTASSDDNTRMTNLCVTTVGSTQTINQSWRSDISIVGTHVHGGITITSCGKVHQLASSNATLQSTLTDSQSAQASILAQLQADASAKGDNAKLNIQATVNTSVKTGINNKQTIREDIQSTCADSQAASASYTVKNDIVDGDININLKNQFVQDTTLSCTEKAMIKNGQLNKADDTDTQTDTASADGTTSMFANSALFGIIVAIVVVLMALSMVREARIILLWLFVILCVVCIAASVMLTMGVISEAGSLADLDKQLANAQTGGSTGWVPGAQSCFRRNWFRDEIAIKGSTGHPALTGYVIATKKAADPAVPVGEISDKLTGAYAESKDIVACVWHRDTPYEYQLATTVPTVTYTEPGGAAPADNASFWSTGSKLWAGMKVATTGATAGATADVTPEQAFELLQMSDPNLLQAKSGVQGGEQGAATAADTGTLFYYTLDPLSWDSQSGLPKGHDGASWTTTTAYINCTAGAPEPGIVKGWPSGMLSADGTQSALDVTPDGKSGVSTYVQHAFPMSADVGLVQGGCEQSCMVVALNTEEASVPMGIGDMVAVGKKPAALGQATEAFKSGLAMSTLTNMEALMLPWIDIQTWSKSAQTKGSWATNRHADTFFKSSFADYDEKAKGWWSGAGGTGAAKISLRQPNPDQIPGTGGDFAKSTDKNSGAPIWDAATRKQPAEVWFPAWAVGGRALCDVNGVSVEINQVANSVMQFMVKDNGIGTTHQIGPGETASCIETRECLVHKNIKNVFTEFMVFQTTYLAVVSSMYLLDANGFFLDVKDAQLFLVLFGPAGLAAVSALAYEKSVWSTGWEAWTSEAASKCKGDACDS